MVISQPKFNLKPFNTFRMDVLCNRWIEYTSPDDIPGVFCGISSEKFKHIGAGSNLLFVGDYDGVILHSRILDMTVSSDGKGWTLLRCGAGITMDELISQCASNGLWGLENLSGIPGEVGASAVQNIGAYGVEVADVIRKVECYDVISNRFKSFTADECHYGYRDSMFKQPEFVNRYVVTYVTFALTSKASPKLDYGNLREALSDKTSPSPLDVREAVMRVRECKLPSVDKVGSAGSYFKNPVVSEDVFRQVETIAKSEHGHDYRVPHYMVGTMVKIPAAWLIEQSGMKDFRLGNAATWHSQPLVIVNASGQASPNDILALEDLVRERVYDKFSVRLHTEVEHV